MSLQDDLQRNRRVFALLTATGTSDADSATVIRRSATASGFALEDAPPPVRQPARAQEDMAQKAETFSLAYGTRTSRETAMAIHPVSVESIAFPPLAEPAAPPATDPLDSLYHQLETEARRTSQLLGEEDF